MIIQTEKEVQKIRKHGNTQMIYVSTANLASARIKSIIYLQNKNNDDDMMMTRNMVMIMQKESYKAIIIDHVLKSIIIVDALSTCLQYIYVPLYCLFLRPGKTARTLKCIIHPLDGVEVTVYC